VFKDLSKWRVFLLTWLILLGLSTLTTYQHHLIDIVTGAILSHISFIIIPYHKNDPAYQNFRVANYYFLSGLILCTVALLVNKYVGNEGLLFFLPALVMIIVGFLYQKKKIHAQ